MFFTSGNSPDRSSRRLAGFHNGSAPVTGAAQVACRAELHKETGAAGAGRGGGSKRIGNILVSIVSFFVLPI